MANDDCDRNFEKALAHQFRLGAPAGAASGAQNPACPDAEILAAYHERSLSLEELASWNTHIAACARCQKILAQFELTDNIPVAAGEEEFVKENVFGVRDLHLAHVARAAGELPTVAAPAESLVVQALLRAVRAPVTPLAPRNARWRWIAPAGAIAAGLLAWVAVQVHQSIQAPASPPMEVASNSEHPAPFPAQEQAKSSKVTQEPTTKESAPRREVSSSGEYAAGKFSSPKAKPAAKEGSGPPPEPPTLSTDATLDTSSAEMGGVVAAKKQSGVSPPPVQGSNLPRMDRAVAAPAPPAPAKRAVSSAAAATVPQAEAKLRQPVNGSVAVSAETVEVASNAPFQSRIVSSMTTLQTSHMIPAPEGRVIWAVGPPGIIQRSEDGGQTWKAQKSGVTSDLRAGSAPSQKICWVVGSAGVVLRTTDGGKNWVKLTSPSPVAGDLGGVQATDALHATVTDAANKTSFETSDGGMTWTQVAGQ